eukprot:CAMPEP_0170539014 /NCGR_PEP_ID=MMETSP0209-20121228/103660_1 /TAXON_ID=665100 ORGANISM="Litonotus pictus, Strain P1" /NCGR_SAMPLE_ID=MMETSP0209 /ASSEMBLY_ACC=CAM_ASM_000301 /LENGTH=507 /DNA_ID=CAMNT_0010840827 /DNA_START=81 /DNA_END=1601 /DNA_ORIENTATION=+
MFELIGEEFPEKYNLNKIQPSESKSQVESNYVQNFSSIYKIIKKIGQGAYGSVFTCVAKASSELNSGEKLSKTQTGSGSGNLVSQTSHNNFNIGITTQQTRVVKIIKKSDKYLSESNRELIKKLDHPNVIKIHDVLEDESNIYLIQEYCEDGDLWNFLRVRGLMNISMAKNIIRQVLSAVNFLHKQNIIHRDIKPENILISYLGELDSKNNYSDIQVKITDFGSATFFNKDDKIKEAIGSPYYIAPEVIVGNYTSKCDVWSVGVILYILLCGKPPYEGKQHSLMYKVVNCEFPYLKTHTKEAREFISSLMDKDQYQRIDAKKAIEHPFLNKEDTEDEQHIKVQAVETLTNMKDFLQGGTLRKMIMSYIAEHKLYEENNSECARIFHELDKNHDGQLDKKELFDNFGSFFVGTEEMEQKQIEDLVDNIDVNNNGKIDYSEFMIVIGKLRRTNQVKVISGIFDLFDVDKSGFIEVEDLNKVLRDIDLPDKNFQKMIDECDENGDGKLSS